jgi:serine phosphatase RsbU (regulator of sigma subunit)
VTRPTKEGEIQVGGLPLWARFTLSMSIALAIVMSIAGFFLYQTSAQVARAVQDETLLQSVQLTGRSARQDADAAKLRSEATFLRALEQRIDAELENAATAYKPESPTKKALDAVLTGLRDELKAQRLERGLAHDELMKKRFWRQLTEQGTQLAGGKVIRADIEYGADRQRGVIYRYQEPNADPFFVLMPDSARAAERGLLGLIVGVTLLVILVGAGVSVYVASQVSGPIVQIVEDVRQISTGDLAHRTHARGGGEIALLARAIDRMTKSLAEARENEVELQIREREVEVAGEVRSALLPQTTPQLPGYDVGALHLASGALGGDFHDFVETSGEHGARVALLACEVSGKGLPGALVGATARAYLRAELATVGHVRAALERVNRELARDVRRGMAVTALCAQIDPATGVAIVACAGHKIPLMRYTAADKKLRLLQPEGIALAFDKGPVFERTLQIAEVPLEPGDRLVLCNSGAVSIVDPEGVELGEKPLYAHVMKLCGHKPEEFLERLRTVLEAHAGGAPLARDVAIVTIART